MLLGSTALETAVGLALVYLLLSLVCSAVQELLAQLLALRSRTLFSGIENMLSGDLAKQLYAHPLINTQYRQGWFDKLVGRPGRPSYIAASTFVTTLIDVLQPDLVNDAQPQAKENPQTQPTQAHLVRLKSIRPRLEALLHPAQAAQSPRQSPPSPTPVPDALREAIQETKDGRVQRALLLLLSGAEHDYDKFKLNLAQWYDNTMERVSGWYRRKVQITLLVIATVATLALGVDTISISTALWKQPTLRTEAVAVVQQTLKQTRGGATGSSKKILDLNRQLDALQLPIGWTARPSASDHSAWAIKILGLMLTSFAVSLGSPFWFGVLSKITNIRGAGVALPSESSTAKVE